MKPGDWVEILGTETDPKLSFVVPGRAYRVQRVEGEQVWVDVPGDPYARHPWLIYRLKPANPPVTELLNLYYGTL